MKFTAVATWGYLLLLLGFGVSSSIVTWASEDLRVLIIEICTNAIFLAGVALFALRARLRWWIALFGLAAVGESFLLFTSDDTTAKDVLLWVLILLPAVVMNLAVANVLGRGQTVRDGTDPDVIT
jgi:hypothetical protein